MDSSRGGMEVVVEELAPRLIEIGCEVIGYNRTDCGNRSLLKYKGVKLILVSMYKRKGPAVMTRSVFTTVRAYFGERKVKEFKQL